MQLKNSTDYAIRIVCYLAAQERMVSTSELSRKLNVSANYVPKIAKKLKNAKIVTACEGTNGGYMLAKQPENISLMDIISCVEETMAIHRCLEDDRFCSRNLEDTCKIHKILLSLQNTYNNKLESVKVSDVIRPGEDEYFGRFYVVLKLNLKEKSYECVYSHIREVYEKVRKTESYEEFISQYVERYVYASDKKMVHDFLSSEGLGERLVDGCEEQDLPYRSASVAHLAPIHDIGKIKVPIEILNKNGKLTDEEMNVVKQHPLVGAAMTKRFPEGITTEKLNQYSYEICRHHHERYDGSGYPDGLKGNAIPMCAQVVGIVDAYDALINDRPYKRKYEPEEAIQMISNGECGAFSNQLMQCFQEAAKQPEWLKVTKSQARRCIDQ